MYESENTLNSDDELARMAQDLFIGIKKRANHLASTQSWRQLLLKKEAHDAPVISEEFFKENVNVLLNGIDDCARNPAQWSSEDTNFYFNKIQIFVDSWKKQLLKEKEEIDEEVGLLKEKLENKRDLVTNRLSLLSGVFDESLAFIKFSEVQKRAIQSKVQEVNDDVRSIFGDSSTQVEQQVVFDKCLQDKEKELQEYRKQAEQHVQELLNIIQTIQSKQKEVKEKLSEIRTLLLRKNPENKPDCPFEIESLSKEEDKILKDIKALIEFEIQSSKGYGCKKNTKESVLETDGDSASLRVSEYEMHLVTVIASLLKVTPFPVSAKFVHSYIANIDDNVDIQFVESLLKKFPSFFKEGAVAPGSMEKNWSYIALKPVITI